MLTNSKRTLICLGVSKVLIDHSLTFVVLGRYQLLISAVEVLIDSKELSDGRFVTHLFDINFINLLHNVDVEVIDGSLGPGGCSGECTLNDLGLLHVLLRDFIEADDLLLHTVELALEHLYQFLRLFVVLLD